ncbi:Abi family protein [uncultured Brachyspira sp.]|uniref:Abi family protein n=1 Tax=uncultured Brachyspira sp. TaxID=221953 RepID=UPI0025D3EC7A|nr:Abi family protein [uncultured Brachyspira sp.]
MDFKPPRSYKEQLQIIKDRGCIIDDECECIAVLESVNYYRLSAYFLPFKNKNNTYKGKLSFNRVYSIYEFDRKLRSILLTALEEIEIFLRAKIAYFHVHKYTPIGYTLSKNFYKCTDDKKHIQKKKKFHEKFIESLNREIKNNEKVLFVKHHINKYKGNFPMWVASEIFTFGMLSIFFSNLKLEDKKALSRDIYNTIPKNIESWLRCCTDIRNICAHYGRLYFRTFTAIPAGIKCIDEKSNRRLWGAVFAIKKLYPFKDKWNDEILKKLISIVEEHKKYIDLEHIAFPNDWNALLIKL